MRKWIIGLLLVLAVRTAQPAPVPEQMKGATDDLKTLVQDTNAKRFDALTVMLSKRRIPYHIEVVKPPDGRNIIVTLGSGRKDIVICAHYDAARMSDGKLSQGAVDNGAAVVALVRLAETLGKMRLRHRIRVVFFDMEEANAQGSSRFVLKHKKEPITAAVNVDIISSGNAVIFSPGTVPGDRRRVQLVEKICAEQGVPHILSMAVQNSDQKSFDRAGIPSIGISVIPEPKVGRSPSQNDAGVAPPPKVFTLPSVHSPDDNVSAVSLEAMSTAYNVILAMVKKLDAE